MDYDAPTFMEAAVAVDAASKNVVAMEAFAPGHVIFSEVAIVSSVQGVEPQEEVHDEDCDDDDCGGCAEVTGDEDDEDEDPVDALDEDELAEVSPYVVEHFDELMSTCEPHEALSSVDMRKNLFKLLHLHETAPLTPLLTFDVVADDVVASLDAAKALREAHPDVVPASLTDDQVAHLIGVLNKYAMPLSDLPGSGFFLHVAKLQHSCTPNAAFSDVGNEISITAIRPIAVGDPITVDYFDSHYMCAADRAEVMALKGRACSCGVCVGVDADKTRSFKCQESGCDGIVHPTKTVFECNSCHAVWDIATVVAAEKEEATLTMELEVTTSTELVEIIQNSLLHPYHYIFFSAMKSLTVDSGEDVEMTADQELAVLHQLVVALEYVAPRPLWEMGAFYNAMAAAHITNGDISNATDAYSHAYNVCAIVFGTKCKETKMFKDLMEDTPTTPEDLVAAYERFIE